jgi:anaerobic magnesium-protoporphyrin IX monomethyl ester cyclase
MKVLVLNPPFLKHYARAMRCPAVTKSGTIVYPCMLMALTAVLEKAGCDVKLYDCAVDCQSLEELARRVREFKPGLIVSDTSTASIYNDCRVAEALKEAVPESYVVLVGAHVSALPEQTLNISPAVDAVARREYDYTIRELASVLENGGDPASVAGISFRADGKIVHNPDRPYIADLDKLPFASSVCKTHIKIRDYFYSSDLYPIITVCGSRGCPYQCTYCLFPQTLTGHEYRVRSVDNIIAEIEYILKEFPYIREIKFEDDIIMGRERYEELCGKILSKNMKFIWAINARADLPMEVMQLMRKAGCRLLCVGIESGNQKVLDGIGKRITVEQIRRFASDAKKAGILIHGCFLVGGPGETPETLEETLAFAIALEPDTAQFFPISYYPGTRAYEWAKQNGYLTTEDFSKWLTPDGMLSSVVKLPGLSTTQLVDFCDYARRKFYLRPKYCVRKMVQCIRHPFEAQRTFKALNTFRRHLLRRHAPNAENSCGCAQ